MIIYINDKACEAQKGDILLEVARRNKCHIGYICGGNGICQSCFVTVSEGMEHLSKPGSDEKAFISDRLFEAGGRLACRTRVTGEKGTIRLLSRTENLKRIVLGLNVPGFFTYAQTIGYNVLKKLPEGAGSVVERVRDGRINPGEALSKIGSGIGDASQLAASNFMEAFSFLQYPVSMVTEGAKTVYGGASGALCSISGGALHLPGTQCTLHRPQEPESRQNVTITSR
ncbi:MAG TPA: chlorosome protein J [Chlorobium sp.]|uniref:Ferredoxin n=1 Tax=Chlorobium phaeovibrioides (strain DSM 265 / 1930) TaxID=290318 RepID=A4SFA4_CHLPM|nr:chlorosome protein J [Chlorobium sp.]